MCDPMSDRMCHEEDGADMSILHDPPERATLTVDEAAIILGTSRTTAYESVRRGEIPARRFGRRVVILRHQLEQLLGRSSIT